ncbi:MFS transporter [Microlunatus speluncae]|uniref:MFS transporter n=1 Tax=Microlunatus speluncae TaxID=2594267 RepID=UPI001C2CFD72|nr:MFS transporter [Microlunatus speluncae]
MTCVETQPKAVTRTEAAPARRVRSGLVLALACTAQAMIGLDMAIVNVALPSIQTDLGVGHGAVQWVIVAYGLLLGGFLLFGGRLSDQLGRRRIFVTGLAIFTAASLLAGVAPNAGVLIAARAVQGFGAALIAPAALSLIAVTFAEGRERNRAFGFFGAVGGVSGSVGVVASGLLTGGPGWRWAFLINIPAGALMITLALVFLAVDHAGRRTARLDVAGATTVTGGLLLLVYALHHGASHGWVSVSTWGLFAAAVGLLIIFVRIEARSQAPLVPPATWRNRTLVVANVTAFLATCAFLAFIFIGSLLMQQALGYSPLLTGVAWLATTATILPVALVGARLAAVVGVRPLLLVGLSLFGAGALWLARIPADGSYLTDLLPAFLAAGFGFGLCGPALQISALSGVSQADAGLASGLLETMREVGGAAGVAAVATVLVAGAGLAGFHLAFGFIGLLALLAALTAAIGFARGCRSDAGSFVGGAKRIS